MNLANCGSSPIGSGNQALDDQRAGFVLSRGERSARVLQNYESRIERERDTNYFRGDSPRVRHIDVREREFIAILFRGSPASQWLHQRSKDPFTPLSPTMWVLL